VRNIWAGFVRQPRYAFTGSNITPILDPDGKLIDGPYPLDMNNDDVVQTEDTADVYMETRDANPDKDGWRNFSGLPWTTQIQKPLAYERDRSVYSDLLLSSVQ